MSYFDHPSLVAVLIRISTAIFGASPFGVRFFSTIISTTIIVTLSTLVSRRQLLTAALFTPLFLWGGVLMTPDTPLLLFWTLYLLWTIDVVKRLSEWGDDPIARVYRPSPVSIVHWAVGGVLLGLGMNSKYTMVFAPLCLWVCLWRFRLSAWIKGFLLQGGLGLLLFTPVLIFNARHGFEPILFQFRHGLSSDTVAFRFFGEFLTTQILVVGLMPMWMILWQLLRFREVLDYPLVRVSSAFFTIPFLFFLLQAARGKVEGNWVFLAYISFWPLAQLLLDHASFRRETGFLVTLSFVPCLLVSLLFAVHLVVPLKWVRPAQDRIGKLRSQEVVFHTVAEKVHAPELPVFATTYQNVAQFRRAGVQALQLPGYARPSQFTLDTTDPCGFDRLWLLQEVDDVPPPVYCFSGRQSTPYPLIVRNETVHTYYLVQYSHKK